ncbi:MAG TPA: ComF family protein [Allosphingosinicella sp.]|jgi:ComF family protein|uniref:double zinc ribbon domain-containing protein n=1 Tax=Allosphingosinicella sp. TaxID=2823234 RepID=UPI002F2908C9
MQMLASAVRLAGRTTVDFALPPRCPGCGLIVKDQHRFCLQCWQALQFLGEPCCARCALPFEFDAGEGAECGACIADPPRFDQLRAAVAYGEIARAVALKLKYAGRPGVAETMAQLMSRHLDRGDPDVILVPVPLHRWRIWKRGYNQSALIASAPSRRTGLRAALALIERIKATPPLKGLGRRERADAVRGAFRLSAPSAELAKDRTIILVDDVFTSGATANACAQVLKRNGAARVHIICWARVIGEH